MRDLLETEIKRMDFVRDKHTRVFLVAQQEDGLQLWDFQAWLAGYYDAYIPLSEYQGELEIIGNLADDPYLLPKECKGYNGEPHIELVETIWTR